jgi:hypothetical protein
VLSIVIPPEAFALREVPFQVVSDFRSDDPAGTSDLKRCGIRFGELNPDQKTQLVEFIKKYTIQTEQ